MNRIILIGNGFDLAHNIPTSYQNFIDDYWQKTISEIRKTAINDTYKNPELEISGLINQYIEGADYNALKIATDKSDHKINYKNEFLKIISKKSYIVKWVDIEQEYYTLLKDCFNGELACVKKLNKDFHFIKLLLSDYLLGVQQDFENNRKRDARLIIEKIGDEIYKDFDYRDFSESSVNIRAEREFDLILQDKDDLITSSDIPNKRIELASMMGSSISVSKIRKQLKNGNAISYFDLAVKDVLLLNFNYTSTESNYKNPRNFDWDYEKIIPEVKSLHIHGTTANKNNPIIFGYGDELDDDYLALEKLNNEYLENIKSIKYLETGNYKELLEYINSGNYQIYLMGHSCGISDRTLLNTLFENDNCASIKVFYHELDDGNDNYSDIIRNISRNFNDKAKLRDRVVNKTRCQKLT